MKKLFTILLSSFCILTNVHAQKIAPFHAGDRVAFVGNSITDGGHYHSYIWLYYIFQTGVLPVSMTALAAM
jgi:hypothetical protein